jgi:hypothetical protein
MSADNGIYILKTHGADGSCQFRVRELHNVEALFAASAQVELNGPVVQAVFAGCACYTEAERALSVAHELLAESERGGYKVEHGVLVIESTLSFAT